MAGPAESAPLLLLPPQVALGAAQHGRLPLVDKAQHLRLKLLQDGRSLGKQPAHPLPLCHGCALHRTVGWGVGSEGREHSDDILATFSDPCLPTVSC